MHKKILHGWSICTRDNFAREYKNIIKSVPQKKKKIEGTGSNMHETVLHKGLILHKWQFCTRVQKLFKVKLI